LKFPYIFSATLRYAVCCLTYQPGIHRIEVRFITPPVINAKWLSQTKLSVTTRLRSDEFVQEIPYGRKSASKPDVFSDTYWLLSLISEIKMCADGILNSLPETCAPEG